MASDLPPGLENQTPSTWMGEGNIWTGLGSDGSAMVRWSLGRPDGQRGELQVWFDPEAGHRVSAVRISLPDGLTPTGLGLFPWARWLTIADAARHLASSGLRIDSSEFIGSSELADLERAVNSARDGKRPPRGSSSSRPGRRGHPDSHYQKIARRYLALRQKGIPNPTATIAGEDCVSTSTAAGWVRGARQRGYLPPGRPGRAG